jgi:hypothetical protein
MHQSPSASAALAFLDADERHAEQHAALEDATRRWVGEGDSPQNVADYAYALRALLGEV